MRDGTYHYAIRLHAPIGLRYGMLEALHSGPDG